MGKKTRRTRTTRPAKYAIHCAYDKAIPLDQLTPHPKNPNQHPPGQVAKLARNITEFGWRVPITVSNLSGYIIRGHARLLAAQQLKLKSVPVDYQNYDSDLDELADLIADNHLPELSILDPAKIAEITNDLDADGFDLDLTGYDKTELAEMQAGLIPGPDVEVQRLDMQHPPKTAWVLIACPMVNYGNVADLVEEIGEMPGVIIETVLNDAEPGKGKK